MITKPLINYLLTLPDVTAVVGTRIYGRRAPQGTALPRLRVWVVHTPQVTHLQGVSGLLHPTVEIDAEANDYATAVTLGQTLRNLLDVQKAFIGVRFGTTVRRMDLVDESEDSDDPINANDLPIHRVEQLYSIAYEG